MNLSSRAQSYLATLRRGNPVPVDQVAEALKRAGCPAFELWLDFHSRFAGYQEVIGRETAIWGIVHFDPQWLDPGEARVEIEAEIWRVVCADVHPSYDYWLDSNGQFVSLGGGGSFETFNIRVERDAVFWEATAGNRSWKIDFDLLKTAGSLENLYRAVSAEIVVEASDKYATCWKAPDLIVIQHAAAATVWVAADARGRVLSQVNPRG